MCIDRARSKYRTHVKGVMKAETRKRQNTNFFFLKISAPSFRRARVVLAKRAGREEAEKCKTGERQLILGNFAGAATVTCLLDWSGRWTQAGGLPAPDLSRRCT